MIGLPTKVPLDHVCLALLDIWFRKGKDIDFGLNALARRVTYGYGCMREGSMRTTLGDDIGRVKMLEE